MEYLLKASGIIMILFLFYHIFLKNETFFKSIRGYFLIGLLIVISIPLIEIPIYVEQVSSQLNLLNYQEIAQTSHLEKNTFDWIHVITLIYLLGVIFFSLKFIIQLTSLAILLSKHPFIKQDGYYFVETSKISSPFSFFNIIIYNRSQFSSEELKQIMNHEKIHVSHWHSFDTILAHLLVITLWFNPFVWLYKKAVLQNLEFIADSLALKQTSNQKLYQLTLLKTCGATYCTEITNNFYNSLIKKRIIMLNKNQSKNKNQWKYALLLPLLIAFVATFNTKIVAQEKKTTEITITVIDLIIDKNSTDESLKNESAFFKTEHDIVLSFKGIKRNTDNEITAIKIDAKGKGLSAKFENKGTNPIHPIKLSFDSESNFLNISNISKAKKGSYSYKTTVNSDVEFIGDPENEEEYIFVTTDGDKTTWTSKNKKEEKNVKIEILKKSDLKDKKLRKTKEIHIISDSEDEVEINKDEENNIFIIKNDNDSIHKMSKKGNLVVFNSGKGEPLYYANGKEITSEEMKKISPDTIEKMEVFKGEKAIEKYGEKAKNGVILLTTKKE